MKRTKKKTQSEPLTMFLKIGSFFLYKTFLKVEKTTKKKGKLKFEFILLFVSFDASRLA